MKSLHEYKEKPQIEMVKRFVTFLFEVRQTVHVIHLGTKSYAEHVALNGYYDSLLDLIDEFVETYQGQHGLVDLNKSLNVSEKNPIACLKNVIDESSKIRQFVDTHLQNIIDEIVALSYRTKYKLEYLK
jgi:hypothetical protein